MFFSKHHINDGQANRNRHGQHKCDQKRGPQCRSGSGCIDTQNVMFLVRHAPINDELGFHSVNCVMEFLHTSLDDTPLAPCAMQQHPFYAKAITEMGADMTRLRVIAEDATLAQVQVMKRSCGPLRLRWLPRGPVWSSSMTQGQKISVLAKLPMQFDTPGVWVSSAENQTDSDCFAALGYRPVVTAQHVAELDLTPSRETRLMAQHGKWRNRLRRAEKSHLRVVHRALDMGRDADLLALETLQRRNRRYAALPIGFCRAWADTNPGETRLFRAKLGAETQAYILILLHAPTATYHIGWTSHQGRRASAHHLLIWQAANWLADAGYTRLDLGTVDTRNTPGLARFKIGSGAHARPLGPTLIHLPLLNIFKPKRHAAA